MRQRSFLHSLQHRKVTLADGHPQGKTMENIAISEIYL